MAFDPFLYVAFVAGLVAGRLTSWRSPWVPRLTLGTVAVLLFLLGITLRTNTPVALLETIPLAVAFAALVLALTVGICLALDRQWVPARPALPAPPERRFPTSVALLVSLVAGYAAGAVVVPATAGTLIPFALYALLALVAFDLRLRLGALRTVGIPLLAAVSGAVGAATVVALTGLVSGPVAFATFLAFGWYSLAGPLVAASVGALAGLVALLTNILRENLTMLLAPVTGRRLRGEGLAAMGGATAMDTTLWFVVTFGDREAGTLALATGFVLTVLASVAVPAVLTFR